MFVLGCRQEHSKDEMVLCCTSVVFYPNTNGDQREQSQQIKRYVYIFVMYNFMKLSCLDFSELIHYEIFRCDRCSLVDICSFNLNENLQYP